MADYDPNSIPILDDIISTGDTDKAANRPDDDVQKSLELGQPEETDTVSESTEENLSGEVEPDETIMDESGMDEIDPPTLYEDHDLSDSDITPASSETVEDSPIEIETLTEDILTSIMPEMEHLLRERIRQILEQQLQNND